MKKIVLIALLLISLLVAAVAETINIQTDQYIPRPQTPLGQIAPRPTTSGDQYQMKQYGTYGSGQVNQYEQQTQLPFTSGQPVKNYQEYSKLEATYNNRIEFILKEIEKESTKKGSIFAGNDGGVYIDPITKEMRPFSSNIGNSNLRLPNQGDLYENQANSMYMIQHNDKYKDYKNKEAMTTNPNLKDTYNIQFENRYEEDFLRTGINKYDKGKDISAQMEVIAKDTKVYQFGYDFFNKEIKADYLLPVGETYKLGPGDTLSFYLWGDPIEILGLNGFYSLEIDRDGKVFIPTLGAIYVWGMNIGEVKATLRKLFSKKFKKFELELTLGKIRNFPIYITGEVGKQGILFVNGTNSVLDALTLAGGVTKNGSLRDVVLKRYVNGKLTETHIDLYDILLFGNPINIQIKEGDSIFVKSIGKTVAIFGDIKRQAIYEIKDNDTLSSLFTFTGGFLPTANTKSVKTYKLTDNKQSIVSIDNKSTDTVLSDGDIVQVVPLNLIVENKIAVLGHVKYPGEYAYEDYSKLSAIMKKVGLLPDTDIRLGEIYRLDPLCNKDGLITFTPIDIIQGKNDIMLKPMDKISFYKMRNFEPITLSGEVENPTVVNYYDNITLTQALRSVRFKGEINELKLDIFTPDKQYRSIYLQDLLVRGNKEYDIALFPGTQIIVKKTSELEKDRTVKILGEVIKPGTYKLKPGMTLYDLINEAGGYTEYAYPRSLVFIRESAKKLQYEQLQLTLITMEETLSKNSEVYKTAGGSEEEKAMLQLALNKQQRSFELLKRKAEMGLGRIALEIPEKLEDLRKSDQNIDLQDGDSIYIPTKPSFILVLGSVYNQISLPFKKDYKIRDYIEEVGGLSKDADNTDVYIIKANGKIVSQRNFSSKYLGCDKGNFYFIRFVLALNLEQGDTVVIPEEIKVPVLWMPLIRDVTSILFQAISTVAIVNNL
jgi:protein involved in polysaccharide export with SLBB domain